MQEKGRIRQEIGRDRQGKIQVIVRAQPQPQPNSTSTRVGVDKVNSWTTTHPLKLPDNLGS